MSYPFGPQAPGADRVAIDLAELVNWLVHQPFFAVAEVLPLAAAQVRRPGDAALLLRALADRLDPARAAMPLLPAMRGPFHETRLVAPGAAGAS